MNIDFAHHAGFSIYVVLLMVSGAVMLGMASPAVRSRGGLLRLLNAAFGLGFVAYGFYLAFLFHGGSYVIFFKAFILPVLMIFRTVRSAKQAPKGVAYAASMPQRVVNPYASNPYAGSPYVMPADSQSVYAAPVPGYPPAVHAALPGPGFAPQPNLTNQPVSPEQSQQQPISGRSVDGQPLRSLNAEVFASRGNRAPARLVVASLLSLALVAGVGYALTRPTGPATSSIGTNTVNDRAVNPGGVPETQQRLNAVVLQPEDVPAGWTATPATGDPKTDTTNTQMTACAGAGSTKADELASAQSADYALGNIEVSSSATTLRTRDAVRSDIAALHRPNAKTCLGSMLRNAFLRNVPGATVDAPKLTLTFGPKPNVIATATGSLTARKNGRHVTLSFCVGFIAGSTVEAEVNGLGVNAPVPASLMKSLIAKVATRVRSH